MKKLSSFILVIFMISVSPFGMVTAEENIKVLLNGTELSFDVPPQIIDGRTLVPMRAIFEALGAEVDWDNDTQKISAVCGICKSDGITHNITMTIGDLYMYTYRAEVKPNEPSPPGMAKIELDVPPMLVRGRTLVPIRAVEEGLNAVVEWDEETWTVTVKTDKYENVEPITERCTIRVLIEDVNSYLYPQSGILTYSQGGEHGRGGTYGIIDIQSGEITPLPQYAYVSDFTNGFAIARYDEKVNAVGIIDRTGNLVIPVEYQKIYVAQNENGICLASKIIDGVEKWGKIDIGGNIIVPFVYSSAESLDSNEKLYVVQDGNKYGLNDFDGNVIIPLGSNKIEKNNYHTGFRIYHTNPTISYGVAYQYVGINENGEISFSDIYNQLGFHGADGLAFVSNGVKYGYINLSGELVIPLMYDRAEVFSEGLAAVKKGDKWGFIDTNGDVVIDFKYDDGGSYSLWDARFLNGFSRIKKDGKLGVLGKGGEVIIPFEFDEIRSHYVFDLLSEYGFVPVKRGGLWGIIDINGNMLLDCTATWIGDFNEGYAFFKEGDTSGIINQYGEVTARNLAIEPIYVYETTTWSIPHVNPTTRSIMSSFNQGLACVRVGDKWGYINTVGKTVIEPWLDTVITPNGLEDGTDRQSGGGDFTQRGFARVYCGGLWNIINKVGYPMLGEWWEEIQESDEYYICQNENGDLKIVTSECEPVLTAMNGLIINEIGELVLRYEPKSVRAIGGNLFSYSYDGKTGVFIVENLAGTSR